MYIFEIHKLRYNNFIKINELLANINYIESIKTNVENIIASSVNGEILSVKLMNFNDTVAVKTIPITKNNYDNFIIHNINVISPIAEIKALEICTQYVLTTKSPHFNIMYKYLLCNNCKYIGTKIQSQHFNDTINPSYKVILDVIKKEHAQIEIIK